MEAATATIALARRTQGGSGGGGGARSARYPGGGGAGGGRSRAVDRQAGELPHVRKAGRRRRKGTKPGAATHISAGHMSASFRGRYTRCVLAVVAGVALGACWQVPPAVALGAFLQTGVSVRTERCRRSWRDTRRCGLRPDRRRAWWGRPRAAFAADRRAKRLLIFSSRCVCRSVAAVVPIRGPAVAPGRQRPSHAARS